MRAARIVAPFSVSAILFVLAFLSSKETNSGFFPIMLFGVGFLLALVGVAAVFSDSSDRKDR
jgi:hypothetical protein